jgi:hypothetical protein
MAVILVDAASKLQNEVGEDKLMVIMDVLVVVE